MTNPVTKNYAHFEDLFVDQKIDLGATKVTKEMIFEFATEFDPFPFHLDEEAANASLLGGLSASGWHTGAIALAMLLENLPSKLATAGGVGFTNLKWKRPVMVNDTIGGTVTISEMRRVKSRPEWGLITLDFDIRNQKDQQVMTMSLKNLVDVRNPAAPIGEALK
ncbi:MAG: MaoC family dehydratase [Devosiaceae bacterium]|nr:MaoC family dehydratase [Devosiaceae bacterium]